MAKKQAKMVRVQLSGGPYDSLLFCPYCGTQILEPEGEDIENWCPHLIHAGIEDLEEAEEEFLSNDLCFVFFEGAPASREHYFVFREAGEADESETEEP